jgi:hypothetical protein
MSRDPRCTEHLEPSEAYCGFAIDDQLFVFEFDGRGCSDVVAGGNELDLDFVVAGSQAVWRQAVEALGGRDASATLPALVAKRALEIRSTIEAGPELGRKALPFLQVFLEQARTLELSFD